MMELGQKGGPGMIGTRTRDGLDGSKTIFLDRRTIGSQDQSTGGVSEGRLTGDGLVFMVKCIVIEQDGIRLRKKVNISFTAFFFLFTFLTTGST